MMSRDLLKFLRPFLTENEEYDLIKIADEIRLFREICEYYSVNLEEWRDAKPEGRDIIRLSKRARRKKGLLN